MSEYEDDQILAVKVGLQAAECFQGHPVYILEIALAPLVASVAASAEDEFLFGGSDMILRVTTLAFRHLNERRHLPDSEHESKHENDEPAEVVPFRESPGQ
jgi:hypothetical protein